MQEIRIEIFLNRIHVVKLWFLIYEYQINKQTFVYKDIFFLNAKYPTVQMSVDVTLISKKFYFSFVYFCVLLIIAASLWTKFNKCIWYFNLFVHNWMSVDSFIYGVRSLVTDELQKSISMVNWRKTMFISDLHLD